MPNRDRRIKRKEPPAICPFCEQLIPRPLKIEDEPIPSENLGGKCSCGSLFIFDETGKRGGKLFMDLLTWLCQGDVQKAIDLERGVHYEFRKFGYRPKTHSLEKHLAKHGGFGMPKLYFVKSIA